MAYVKKSVEMKNFLGDRYEEKQIEHYKAKASKARARGAVEDASILEQMAEMHTKSMEFRTGKSR